jgi:8-oxo-dGTP pyrophosphatase MutT (NUDIX family)
MPFEIPRGRILPVEALEICLDPAPHPFERDNMTAIEANWREERAANPSLFDGKVVLLSDLAYRSGRLAGRCHAVRYATFMYWRKLRPVSSAEHIFAHPILVTNENALVAIRSGMHTVNAGLVYFAAGSFEPGDFREGLADLDHNMRREVAEETGLDLSHARREALHLVSGVTGTVVFRRYHFGCSAAELAAEVDAYARACENSEIDGAVIISDDKTLPRGLAPHMPQLIEWHFSQTAADEA